MNITHQPLHVLIRIDIGLLGFLVECVSEEHAELELHEINVQLWEPTESVDVPESPHHPLESLHEVVPLLRFLGLVVQFHFLLRHLLLSRVYFLDDVFRQEDSILSLLNQLSFKTWVLHLLPLLHNFLNLILAKARHFKFLGFVEGQ